MKLTCLLLSTFFAVVYSASIHPNAGIDIPVKVIYSDEEFRIAQEPLNDQATVVEVEQINNVNSNENLSEKIQLSVSDALQVDKHLPDSGVRDLISNAEPEINAEKENLPVVENPKPIVEEKPVETSSQVPSDVVPNNADKEDIPSQPATSAPVATTAEVLPDPNYVLLIQVVQKIVNEGLEVLQKNINKYVDAETLQPAITAEQWTTLNQTITDYFSLLLQQNSRKNNFNIIGEAVSGVRDITNAFVFNLRESTDSNLRQEPIGSGIVNYVSNGFQQITNRIDNLARQNTTTSTILNQGETTNKPPSGPIQGFQNAANQVGQAISNLNPFNQRPNNKTDDEATTVNPALQGFQNAANQFSSAIQGLNPFNQPPPPAANSQGDEEKPPNPLQGFQNAANELGQAILALNPFNQPPPPASGAAGSQGDEGSAVPPLQGFQNAANQFGQSILNLNPFNAQSNNTNGGNPLEGFQNAANQFGQAISGLNPFSQRPEGSADNITSNNPLQGFQNAANQVVQAIGGLNVFNQVPPAATGSQGDEVTTGNPLQPFQNAANQIGSAINSLNPFNQPPQPHENAQGDDPTTRSPLQPFQNAFQNFANAVNSLNPFNQVAATEKPLTAVPVIPVSEPVGTNPIQNNTSGTQPGDSNYGVGSIINIIGDILGSGESGGNGGGGGGGGENNNMTVNKKPCAEFLHNVAENLPKSINPKRPHKHN